MHLIKHGQQVQFSDMLDPTGDCCFFIICSPATPAVLIINLKDCVCATLTKCDY